MKLPHQNLLTPERLELGLRTRFNPTIGITPNALAQAHDQFDRGFLREAALLWDVIEDRDDLIKSVAGKRKKNIARNGFEVVTFPREGSPEYPAALKQKEALQFFYDNLLVTNAVDANERGGFKLLIRQMMDAVGKKYAIHEIIWKPQTTGSARVPRAASGVAPDASRKNSLSASGGEGRGEVTGSPSSLASLPSVNPFALTAEFRFVPLWFFENTKGRLRFLDSPYATEGVELAPASWLVTVAEGVMKACATAWMRKNLALTDWVNYSGNYGNPGIIATTSALRNTPEFDNMVDALEEFWAKKMVVLNSAETMRTIDLASSHSPFDLLVERMDRLISALWRGSDLSTISKSQGYGASLQQGETQILEEDDAELITETLQKNIDRVVIDYTFGEGALALAGVTVQQTPRRGTQQDMIIDEFLVGAGMDLSVRDAAKRYGRAIADPGEPTLRIAPKQLSWWKPGSEPQPGSESFTPMRDAQGQALRSVHNREDK